MTGAWWWAVVVAVGCGGAMGADVPQPNEFSYNPVAATSAVVEVGDARFTVLTPRMLRLEHASGGVFSDLPTVMAVNRLLPVPHFTTSHENGTLVLKTDQLTLTYVTGSKFAAESLKVEVQGYETWTPGKANPGQLLGTLRTLDYIDHGTEPPNGVPAPWPESLMCNKIHNVTCMGEPLYCSFGVASRNGWVLLEDDDTPVLDQKPWPRSWQINTTARVQGRTDWYFLGHGKDYRGALYDYVRMAGRVSLVPRYAAGVLACRWFNYDAPSLQKKVERFKSRELYLDSVVIDMDWHTQPCWGSYSWNLNLIPSPALLLEWFKSKGLSVGLNTHDKCGMKVSEDRFPEFCRAVGWNCDHITTTVQCQDNGGVNLPGIPMDITNETWADAWLKEVLAPIGADFFWPDWQAGSGVVGDLAPNPQIWLSTLLTTRLLRYGDDSNRVFLLGRWGGRGNHRYPVGFMGDHNRKLYQPGPDAEDELNRTIGVAATGTNIAYGMWTTDVLAENVRLIQAASLSSMFRFHSSSLDLWDANNTRTFEATKRALQRRSAMVPYVYTLMKEQYDTGLGPMRPLYYDWTDEEMAYDLANWGTEYMLGHALLVAPIVEWASEIIAKLYSRTLWLPPANWVDVETGTMHHVEASGGKVLTKGYLVQEVPVFARAGSIIPMLPPATTTEGFLGRASRPYEAVEWVIYPGGVGTSKAVLYEDDGMTMGYAKGETEGSYSGLPAHRSYSFRLPGSWPASLGLVWANGQYVRYSRVPVADGMRWYYDGDSVSLIIELPAFLLSHLVEVTWSPMVNESADALWGIEGKIRHGMEAAEYCQEGGVLEINTVATYGQVLTLYGNDTTAFKAAVSAFGTVMANASAAHFGSTHTCSEEYTRSLVDPAQV